MKLGLGTVQLGTEYGIANKSGRPDKKQSFEILKAAYDNGIIYFDTAAAYGESENIIGQFIKNENVSPQICSKFLSPDTAESELKESLERLGVEELDYYLLHGAGAVFKDGKGFESSLLYLKECGRVKKAGVSVYNAAEILECIKYRGVDVLQVPFNIIDSRLIRSGILSVLKDMGIELHIRSIYLQGLLLMEDGTEPDYLKEVRPYKSKLKSLAEELNLSVRDLAFLYVRDCEFVDKMLVGCENTAQVLENAELYNLPPLDEGMVKRLQNSFDDVEEYIVNPSLWGKGV